jgi:uncharacterized membrane protein
MCKKAAVVLMVSLGLASCSSGSGTAAPTATDSSAATPVGETLPKSQAEPKIASPIPASLRVLGTEPFWNLQIGGDNLTYTTPEDAKGQHALVTRRDRADGADFSGRLGSASLRVEITRHDCSDGMSDHTYPFPAVLILGGDHRGGCAAPLDPSSSFP